jgi:lipoprotein-anchoring transpeptidase ErfK/SrfK
VNAVVANDQVVANDVSANVAQAQDPQSPDQTIDRATVPGRPGTGAYDPALVRLEVLLDRAGFSPGVIDGHGGANLDRALTAYAQARHLPAGPDTVQAALRSLSAQDRSPTMQTYQITAADTAGPFIGTPPKDYPALARLPALSYSSPLQLLAEMFHMDQRLLRALNPTADFSRPGTAILVTAPRSPARRFRAARVEIDKTNDQVRVFGPDGQLAAAYPATVGSSERPAPTGVFAVKGVAHDPDYVFDPSRLTFTPKGATGKLTIKPGPNNPVGTTWIALTYPTYGIHGTPDPSLIGKRASHGCVRLTNWDAAELGRSVRPGVEVDFVGQEQRAR